jgi:23S rRNA (guanosine2251-2'-O)-methyltransferase
MRKLNVDEMGRVSDIQYADVPKNPVVLVLDNVRSLNNVGSAFRTGDAFLIEKVVLCGITGTPPHREIHKTALGAQDWVQWEHNPSIVEALQNLKKEGYLIAIVEQTDTPTFLDQFAPNQKVAYVFGNEMEGVSDEALPLADIALEIPQGGAKHSINVSVCMGIILWHDALMRHKK